MVLMPTVYLISRRVTTAHTSKFPAMLVMAIKHLTVAMVISIESNMITEYFDPICELSSHLKKEKEYLLYWYLIVFSFYLNICTLHMQHKNKLIN